MLERQEENYYYTTKINIVKWYKITWKISKLSLYKGNWTINIRIDTNNNIVYDYRISSHCNFKNAKKLAEVFILNFDPQLVQKVKNDKPKISHDYHWVIITEKKRKYNSSKRIRLDWKKYSFIRCSTTYRYGDLCYIEINKKIKLDKVDEKEHLTQWLKEWNNYDAYIPQFWNIYRICEKLYTIKNKLYQINEEYNWGEKAENIINSKIKNYLGWLIFSTTNLFIKKDYSNTIKKVTQLDILDSILTFYAPEWTFSIENL